MVGPGTGAARHGTVVAPPRVLAPLAHRIAAKSADVSSHRDPDFIRRHLALGERYTSYFSPEVRGVDNLPATGPVLVVGNHSGLFFMPDLWVTSRAILDRRGYDQPSYGLAYDLLFAIPYVGSFIRQIGAIPARGPEAEAALQQGALLLVYPGGDWEACRPWTQRDRVDFGGRTGFVRLALRCGVPVVPVVTHGSHHAVMVLARGERFARVARLQSMGVKVFPLVLGPFGIAPIVTLPLPAATTVQFLPPLDWSDRGPEAAQDVDVQIACYDQVLSVMQAALDRLRAEHPHPVVHGATRLVRRGVGGVAGAVAHPPHPHL